MAQYNITNFKSLYGSSGSTFPDNLEGQISEGDLRQFGEDIADSFLNVPSSTMWGGLWNFAGNSGNFPTAAVAGKFYIAEDDHGSPGDADYVPAGTWMVSKTAGANSFSGYYYK